MSEHNYERLADVLTHMGRTAKGELFLNSVMHWWPRAATVRDDKASIYRLHGRDDWAALIFSPCATSMSRGQSIESCPYSVGYMPVQFALSRS
jgi:hypothetical protein